MEYFQSLPDKIKKHLDELIKSADMEDNEETKSQMTTIWIEKEKMFEDQIKALDMIVLPSFKADDRRGALLLTYSGSLVALSPAIDNERYIEYYSIKLRYDVPEIVIIEESNIAEDISVDNIVKFINGPIQKTSSLFKITSFKEDVSLEEQEKRIRQAVIFLTNAFVFINRTVLLKDKNVPEQFNLKSISRFIANKNGITQKQAKQIVEDYQYMLETGMLLGEKVKIGRLGSVLLKKKKAKKARVGINPKTMEKITIDAKPETMAPKMSFSKTIKEKAATMVLKKES